jgi:hypothetical protein
MSKDDDLVIHPKPEEPVTEAAPAPEAEKQPKHVCVVTVTQQSDGSYQIHPLGPESGHVVRHPGLSDLLGMGAFLTAYATAQMAAEAFMQTAQANQSNAKRGLTIPMPNFLRRNGGRH